LKAERQKGGASPIGKKAKVSDSDKTFGKQVKQKPAQKLVDRDRHKPSPVFMRGVSPAKGDLVVCYGHQSVIGDGDPVCVTSQIAEDMFRAAKGSFAVHHPILPEQLPEEGRESCGWGKILELAMKPDLALFDGALQSCREFATEQAAEHLHRKKEGIARLNPVLAIGRQSTGGNDAVDMRMVFQFLCPGMENAEKPDLGAQMFGIASDLEKGLSAGTEQQVIEHPFVLECKRRQQTGKREDDVNIWGGKQFLTAFFDPTFPGVGLALGTMPISARVVRDDSMAAAGAFIQMSA